MNIPHPAPSHYRSGSASMRTVRQPAVRNRDRGRIGIVFILLVGLALTSAGAERLSTPIQEADALYSQYCSGCHGAHLRGGLGPPLLGNLVRGDTVAQLADSIRTGNPSKGMPAWKYVLTEGSIQVLVDLVQRKRRAHEAAGDHPTEFEPLPTEVLKSELQSFRLEAVTEDVEWPWAMVFLPGGNLLVSERRRGLRILPTGQTQLIDTGTSLIDPKLTDGYRGVAVHPGHSNSGWIYLAYVEFRGYSGKNEPLGMLRVVRGRLKVNRWTDEQTLWTAPPGVVGSGEVWGSNGGRLAFDAKGFLYFSIGEWGDLDREQEQTKPQDLSRPEGKIHRIYGDGRIPDDNPFVHTPRAIPSIWSYGHRVPQGLAFDPLTGELWATEHGPMGGDELNLIRPAANYGWPLITYGTNYTGEPISDKTRALDMQQPIYYWRPSIAISAISFYQGKVFQKWRGSLLVASLKEQSLFRLTVDGDRIIHIELLLKDLGRIRDVASGDDGYIYLLLEETDRLKGRVIRMVPIQ
jgi:aldose sugar dehydrogenase